MFCILQYIHITVLQLYITVLPEIFCILVYSMFVYAVDVSWPPAMKQASLSTGCLHRNKLKVFLFAEGCLFSCFTAGV